MDAESFLWVLLDLNGAALEVHALNNPVDLSAHIGEQLTVVSPEVLAQGEEVVTSSWSNVMEELKDNSVLCSLEVEGQVGELARFRVVDHLSVGVSGQFVVDDAVTVVHVAETMEGPSGEGVTIANVLLVVEIDEMAASVLVEDTLQGEGSLLHELLPLGLEELETLGLDEAWVFFLEESDSCHALVEGWVVDLTSNSDLD